MGPRSEDSLRDGDRRFGTVVPESLLWGELLRLGKASVFGLSKYRVGMADT